MSDTQQGPDWWLAGDGKWYPPERHPDYVSPDPPPPPPQPAEAPGHGWWRASDGRWYPPEDHPNYRPSPSSSTLASSAGTRTSLTATGTRELISLGLLVLGALIIAGGLWGWISTASDNSQRRDYYEQLQVATTRQEINAAVRGLGDVGGCPFPLRADCPDPDPVLRYVGFVIIGGVGIAGGLLLRQGASRSGAA